MVLEIFGVVGEKIDIRYIPEGESLTIHWMFPVEMKGLKLTHKEDEDDGSR